MVLENNLETPGFIEEEFFHDNSESNSQNPIFSSLNDTLEHYVTDDVRSEIHNTFAEDLERRMNGMFVNTNKPFAEAKSEFEKNYIENHLMLNLGIKSEVSRKTGIDDRTLDRKIEKYEIDTSPYDIMDKESDYHKDPFKIDAKVESDFVKIGLDNTIKQYENKFESEMGYDKFAEKIPELVTNITKEINHEGKNPIVSYKDAINYFEKTYLSERLAEFKSPIDASKEIGLGKTQIYKKANEHNIDLKELKQQYFDKLDQKSRITYN